MVAKKNIKSEEVAEKQVAESTEVTTKKTKKVKQWRL